MQVGHAAGLPGELRRTQLCAAMRATPAVPGKALHRPMRWRTWCTGPRCPARLLLLPTPMRCAFQHRKSGLFLFNARAALLLASMHMLTLQEARGTFRSLANDDASECASIDQAAAKQAADVATRAQLDYTRLGRSGAHVLSAFQLRFLLAALAAPTVMPTRQGLALMQGLAAGELSADEAYFELAACLVPAQEPPPAVRPTAAIADLIDAAAAARDADDGPAPMASGVSLKEEGSGESVGARAPPRTKAELRKTMKSSKGARSSGDCFPPCRGMERAP